MDHKTLRPTRLTLWLTVIVLVAALAAGPVGMALAQGGGADECNGLSEADCALLHGAQEANTQRTAMALPAFDLALTINAEGESVEAKLAGNGALIMAPALLDLVALMPDTSQGMVTDMTAMLDVLDAIDETLIESLLTESAGYVQLSSAMFSTPEEAMSLQGDMVLRDSVLYMHLTSPNGADAWFGEELALTSTDLADMRESLEEMRTQFESEEFQAAMAQMSEYQSQFAAMNDVMAKHITVVRGEDASLHDQAMAVFTSTLDLKGLLADPELSTSVYNLLTSPGFEDMLNESGEIGELTPAQIQLAMVAVGMLVEESTITSEQWVGLDDGLLHKTASTIAILLDTTKFGSSDESGLTEPVEFKANMVMEMDDIATVDVAAFPVSEDYFPLDKVGQFLPGSPDIIDRTLELGESFNGAIVGSESDVYAFDAASGDKAEIEVEADGYVSLKLYGPDGFQIDTLENYNGGSLPVEFTVDGTYLAVVSSDASGDVDYTLTLRVP